MKVTTAGRGVLLPELRLALDTSAPGLTSLVSHAHGDHIPYEAREAYASPETADLMALRAPDINVTRIPWRETVRIGEARVTLYPSGHVLGGALTLIEAPDGERLLYTADTKTTRALTCEPAEYPEADTLIVESTFGLPVFRWPARDVLTAQMAAFARDTLAEGAVPVFLAYSLGKGQETLSILGHEGIPTAVHGATWNLCNIYARHGISFPLAKPYAPGEVAGRALVVPPSFGSHPMVTKLDARIAVVSGWAQLSRARSERDADELIPLSDHADFPGLLEIVDKVRAKRIWTNHGYSDVLAHILRRRGHDAQPLAIGHTEEEGEERATEAAA